MAAHIHRGLQECVRSCERIILRSFGESADKLSHITHADAPCISCLQQQI